MKHGAWVAAIYLCAASLVYAATAQAQELDPRTYSNTPTGVNFLSATYGYSSGNVGLDPTVPVEGLDGRLNIGILGYGRSFGLLGRNAKFRVIVPYGTGEWRGLFQGAPASRDAQGFGDIRAKLEWNFVGAPALSSKEFAGYKQETVVGASMLLIAPTSDYNSDELLNLGANRWAVRSELGISRDIGKWAVDFAGNVWLFGDNDNFVGGQKAEQDPLYVLKTNVVYTTRPGLWLAAGFGYGKGGQSTINGVPKDNEQENFRYGLTFAYPINRNNGLRLTVVKAENGGAGAEFDAFALTYVYAWGF